MADLNRIEKATDKALYEWLNPLGFTQDNSGGCCRWEGDVFTYIACTFASYGDQNDVRPFGQIGFRQSSQIYRFFMLDKDPALLDHAVSMTADYANFVNSYSDCLICNSMDEIGEFLEKLKLFVLNQLYPTLMKFTDPVTLVELYRQRDESQPKSFELPKWYGIQSAMTGIILARLFAPQHYDELLKRYRPLIDRLEANPEKYERAKKLLSYLESEPLPDLPCNQ